MKILVLTSELTEQNGWGRYSLDLVRALEERGIECTVATPCASPDPRIRRVGALPRPLDFIRTVFGAPWYALKLMRAAQECDAIHCFVETYAYIAYWLSFFSGKKYVLTVHGTYGLLPYYASKFKQRIHHAALSGAAAVICVSEYTRDLLAARGLANTRVIPNGIDVEKFSAPPHPGFSERENLVVTVGALKRRKGQHISLQAFARMKAAVPDARYCIVGDQDDAAYFRKLKDLAKELSVEDAIQFRASIDEPELLALYRRAKVLALTSLSEGAHFEGFGLVYLEANAAGTPVIGTSGSGASDAVKDGETGMLLPQGDTQAIATAIHKLMTDEQLWTKLHSGGMAWAASNDWGNAAVEYDRVYGIL